MEEKVFEQFCYDFYGELLSERQKTILDYYYNEDYSVSEIGEVIGLTRQGVFDGLRRAKKQMADYEKKLGLVSRYLKTREVLTALNSEMTALLSEDKVIKDPVLQKELFKLKYSIDEIIEGI